MSATLAAYCETVVPEQNLAGLLPRGQVGSRQWRQTIQLFLAACSTIVSVGTKLHLTPQSTHAKQVPKHVSPGPRPWVDDDIVEREPMGSS
jgi:hypothetical protein